MSELTDEECQRRRQEAQSRATLAGHVLMKVRSEDGRTVVEHQKKIASHGAVLFRKMGAAIGSTLVAELQKQIDSGVPTHLFIAVRQGWKGGFRVYRGELTSIGYELPDGRVDLVPDYYRHRIASITTWLQDHFVGSDSTYGGRHDRRAQFRTRRVGQLGLCLQGWY